MSAQEEVKIRFGLRNKLLLGFLVLVLVLLATVLTTLYLIADTASLAVSSAQSAALLQKLQTLETAQWILLVVGIVIAIIVAFVTIRAVVAPIKRASAAIKGMAEGEREIVVKPLREPLQAVKNIAGASLTGRGDIITVLKPQDLVDSALSAKAARIDKQSDDVAVENAKRILVVDDSITTRTLETNILENRGFDVTPCVNGEDAWAAIQRQEFDLVITDVEMPIMNGFELTDKIKSTETTAQTPVIIVTSLAKEDDKRRGIEVGADAYIVKNQFETSVLLETVERLL